MYLNYLCNINVIQNCIVFVLHIMLSIVIEQKLKLVEYSDSDSEPEETVTVSVTQEGPVPVRDSQGRQVAVVEPTPQNVEVVQLMESNSDDEDLEGTGIFEPELDDPLSTQATQGSSSLNQVDLYFVSQDKAESLKIEIFRDNLDIIIISDSTHDTIIISEPGDFDDHRNATSGNYALLNSFLFQK